MKIKDYVLVLIVLIFLQIPVLASESIGEPEWSGDDDGRERKERQQLKAIGLFNRLAPIAPALVNEETNSSATLRNSAILGFGLSAAALLLM